MAIPAVTPVEGSDAAKQAVWTLTDGDPTGLPFQFVQFTDLCWQATGTFGSGTVTLQGSNDLATWFTLSNAAGATAATFTAAGGKTTLERPLAVRAALTGSTGATVVVTLIARRNPAKTI